MFNYQIIIEYLGTNFVGWQIQKNGTSIQSTIQKALSKALKKKIKINGSGRTDAGVHARAQSANFLCSQEIKDKFKFVNTVIRRVLEKINNCSLPTRKILEIFLGAANL